MNAYDFDKTIYLRDSTADFYFYCLKKQPSLLLRLPAQGFAFMRYLVKNLTKTQFKERFYRFMADVPDIERRAADFWETHFDKIQPWYLKWHEADDVVISASPEFLLKPICDKLGVATLIASRVDPKTGRYTGLNCHGREKVRRYREALGDAPIHWFYSDSLSDTPMAELARHASIIRKGQHLDWRWFARSTGARRRKTKRYADTKKFL